MTPLHLKQTEDGEEGNTKAEGERTRWGEYDDRKNFMSIQTKRKEFGKGNVENRWEGRAAVQHTGINRTVWAC